MILKSATETIVRTNDRKGKRKGTSGAGTTPMRSAIASPILRVKAVPGKVQPGGWRRSPWRVVGISIKGDDGGLEDGMKNERCVVGMNEIG